MYTNLSHYLNIASEKVPQIKFKERPLDQNQTTIWYAGQVCYNGGSWVVCECGSKMPLQAQLTVQAYVL